MQTDLDTQMYVGQKAFINKDGKVLVLRDPNYVVGGQIGLDFPGGRYRWGNNIQDELHREVQEETGLKVKISEPFTTWTSQGHSVKGPKHIFLIAYKCEYISGEVILSDEHDKFEWVDKKSYKNWKEDSEYFKALERYFEGT
jgi:8-oxo-dGTP diphosphatase